jgi:hypothetical protein
MNLIKFKEEIERMILWYQNHNYNPKNIEVIITNNGHIEYTPKDFLNKDRW